MRNNKKGNITMKKHKKVTHKRRLVGGKKKIHSFSNRLARTKKSGKTVELFRFDPSENLYKNKDGTPVSGTDYYYANNNGDKVKAEIGSECIKEGEKCVPTVFKKDEPEINQIGYNPKKEYYTFAKNGQLIDLVNISGAAFYQKKMQYNIYEKPQYYSWINHPKHQKQYVQTIKNAFNEKVYNFKKYNEYFYDVPKDKTTLVEKSLGNFEKLKILFSFVNKLETDNDKKHKKVNHYKPFYQIPGKNDKITTDKLDSSLEYLELHFKKDNKNKYSEEIESIDELGFFLQDESDKMNMDLDTETEVEKSEKKKKRHPRYFQFLKRTKPFTEKYINQDTTFIVEKPEKIDTKKNSLIKDLPYFTYEKKEIIKGEGRYENELIFLGKFEKIEMHYYFTKMDVEFYDTKILDEINSYSKYKTPIKKTIIEKSNNNNFETEEGKDYYYYKEEELGNFTKKEDNKITFTKKDNTDEQILDKEDETKDILEKRTDTNIFIKKSDWDKEFETKKNPDKNKNYNSIEKIPYPGDSNNINKIYEENEWYSALSSQREYFYFIQNRIYDLGKFIKKDGNVFVFQYEDLHDSEITEIFEKYNQYYPLQSYVDSYQKTLEQNKLMERKTIDKLSKM